MKGNDMSEKDQSEQGKREIDQCPHCGAALAAREICGKPYYLCGSVGEARTVQCKVHGKAWQDLKSMRVLVTHLVEAGDNLHDELYGVLTDSKDSSQADAMDALQNWKDIRQ